MENKTIKIYNYEDSNAKTQITINSLFENDIISFEQIDIQDIKIFLKHGIFIKRRLFMIKSLIRQNIQEF